MSVSVKKAVLWRRDLKNEPGTMAETLAPLTAAGVDLKVVMGYNYPGNKKKSAIEVYPVKGAKAEKAARAAGLAPATSSNCLLVEGDDRRGLGNKISTALAEEKVNISFVVAQIIGKKYTSVFGFATAKDADKAIAVIKRVHSGVKKSVKTKKRK